MMSRQKLYSITICFITIVLFVLSSTIGHSNNLLSDLPALLTGQADPVSHWLFWDLWLPRALVTVGVAAALAMAGDVFQILTRNPLGSPDIIGINSGAAAGAVLVTLVFAHSMPLIIGALIGSLIALALIVSASRGRWEAGTNVIVAGLAVNAAAVAIVMFGLQGARQESALQMQVWLSGSLAQRSWSEIVIIWPVLIVIGAIFYSLRGAIDVVRLDFQKASSLGVNVNRVSWIAIIAATILAAAAVVSAGPITFLALVAPHITRKMTKAHQFLILPTALTGASILLASDLIIRYFFTESMLPVGIMTTVIGGLYLVILLILQWRNNLN